MTPARPPHGVIEGEKPSVLHLFGTLSGRSCCGKKIVARTAAGKSNLVACQRCIALDKARRDGIPEWF